MTLILGSSSPRRRALLGLLTTDFRVDAPRIDETLGDGPIHEALEDLARRKASAVPGDLVLAADTAVVMGGENRGKPTGERHARTMLTTMQGQTHQVVTAVALRQGPEIVATHCATKVHCTAIPDAALEAYLASGAWQGKAGGYGLQDAAMAPWLTIEGSWTNVVGLPLAETHRLLRTAGVPVNDPPTDEQRVAQNLF